MPATAVISLQFAVTPTVLDSNSPDHTAGLAALQNLGLTVQDGEAFFHRVFYPANCDLDVTSYGVFDAHRVGNFPVLQNTGAIPDVDIQDWQGLPLSLSSLRLVAVEVKPRFPWQGARATGTLTSTNVEVADGDTVTIGTTVYRFKTTMAAAYDVKRDGTNAVTTLSNLRAAINGTGTPGIEYFAGTAKHPTTSATTATISLTLTARLQGEAANTIATTETSSVLSFSAATLLGGLDFIEPRTARGLEGTVQITISNDLLPGTSSFTSVLSSPGLFLMALTDSWTPGATGDITIRYNTTEPTPATDQDINAITTVILIGEG